MADLNVGRVVGELAIEAGKWVRGLADAAGDLDKFAAKTDKIGRQLTMSVSLPMVAAGGIAIKMAADFNKSMANIASLMPGNTARVIELKTAVQDMSISLGKSTEDLAAGLYQVTSAFGDTADSVKILEINAKSAAGGVASTTDAINLTSAVTKAWGDTSAVAIQHASDLALMTVRLGQVTFPELAASIQRVTSDSNSLKISQEELFAVFATATGVTGGAAEVSTQLAGVLAAMKSPTAELTALYGQMGVASGKALIEQVGLSGAISAIVKSAEASGMPLQKLIGSIEGQRLALPLATTLAGAYASKLTQMGDVAGVTDAAFRAQTEGVNAAGHAWEQAKASLVVTAQLLGDTLAPAILAAASGMKPMLAGVRDMIAAFAKLPGPVQLGLGSIAGLALIAGPFLVAAASVVTAIGTIRAAFIAMRASALAAWLAAAGPVGVGIGAVALAGAGAKAAADAIEGGYRGQGGVSPGATTRIPDEDISPLGRRSGAGIVPAIATMDDEAVA